MSASRREFVFLVFLALKHARQSRINRRCTGSPQAYALLNGYLMNAECVVQGIGPDSELCNNLGFQLFTALQCRMGCRQATQRRGTQKDRSSDFGNGNTSSIKILRE
jgi:hypothetical protein